MEAGLEAARAEIAGLRTRVAELDARLSRSVEVTWARVAAFALWAFLATVSFRDIRRLMEVAFGSDHAWRPADIQGFIRDAGRTPGDLLAVGRAQVKDRIEALAADDVYFHRQDVNDPRLDVPKVPA
jgi:hypothetical protein